MCLNDYKELAKLLKPPPMFTDVLPLLINPDEVELLLTIGKDTLSIDEIGQRSNLPSKLVKDTIHDLFVKGFLKKKRKKRSIKVNMRKEAVFGRFTMSININRERKRTKSGQNRFTLYLE